MTSQDYNILGIDYGDARVGLALAHNIARLPQPYGTLANNEQLLQTITQIVHAENIQRIVLGLPVTQSGGESEQTQKVRQFCNLLQKHLRVSVDLIDESYTSVEVEESLGTRVIAKGGIDARAAAAILDRYFLEHRGARI